MALVGGEADDGVAARAHAALAGVGLRAEIAVVAGGAVGLETVVRAGGAGPRAVLRRVALIRRRPTLGGRRLEGVGGAVVAAPVAGRGHVAGAGRRAALGGRGLLGILGAVRARPRAGLGHVAGPGCGPALRPGVTRRVLAGVVGPVALIERAGIRVGGARRPARLLLVRRAGLARDAGAGLDLVALAHRRPADKGARPHHVARADG